MELRAYLRILMSKWWVVLVVFLVTYGVTLVLSFTQRPVYEARATYVVKLSANVGNEKDLASAVDILSRRTEIATTYTIVANSRQIKALAASALGLTPQRQADVKVSSQLVPGTNIVEITTQSSDPVLARDFTDAVGAQLAAYARNLYATYTLEPLDQASLPSRPIRPDKVLNLMLGGAMGLVLGVGLAFLAAYLQAPPENVTSLSLLDEETGVYNRRYLTMRLRQELSRAQRMGYSFSLALLNADHQRALHNAPEEVRREVYRRVALLLAGQLREEDTMASFGGGVFAFLLPDMAGDAAKELVERLQLAVSSRPIVLERSNTAFDLRSSAGIVTYAENAPDQRVEAEQLLEEVARSLRASEVAPYGTIHMTSVSGTLHDGSDVRSLLPA
ncbi:MAG TPA: diguanylate cyclase [Roseiflexaceae bacterium]|nr:diguanylate cyclase [Roseiflexaceae bacterium]